MHVVGVLGAWAILYASCIYILVSYMATALIFGGSPMIEKQNLLRMHSQAESSNSYMVSGFLILSINTVKCAIYVNLLCTCHWKH